jgi:hypothetical protein
MQAWMQVLVTDEASQEFNRAGVVQAVEVGAAPGEVNVTVKLDETAAFEEESLVFTPGQLRIL